MEEKEKLHKLIAKLRELEIVDQKVWLISLRKIVLFHWKSHNDRFFQIEMLRMKLLLLFCRVKLTQICYTFWKTDKV